MNNPWGVIPTLYDTMSKIWLSIVAWLCKNVKVNIVDLYEWTKTVDGDNDGNITLGEVIDYVKRRIS